MPNTKIYGSTGRVPIGICEITTMNSSRTPLVPCTITIFNKNYYLTRCLMKYAHFYQNHANYFQKLRTYYIQYSLECFLFRLKPVHF